MFFEFSFWDRLLIFIVGMAIGFLFVLKPLQIVDIIGKTAWAEAKWPGGTFGAVKAFGIAIMIVAVIVLFNF